MRFCAAVFDFDRTLVRQEAKAMSLRLIAGRMASARGQAVCWPDGGDGDPWSTMGRCLW